MRNSNTGEMRYCFLICKSITQGPARSQEATARQAGAEVAPASQRSGGENRKDIVFSVFLYVLCVSAFKIRNERTVSEMLSAESAAFYKTLPCRIRGTSQILIPCGGFSIAVRSELIICWSVTNPRRRAGSFVAGIRSKTQYTGANNIGQR